MNSNLIQSLSEKSDQELIAVLEKPADWVPDVVEFARLELTRRSVDIPHLLAVAAEQQAEKLQERATQSLTLWESLDAAIAGFLSLIGLLFFMLPRSAHFKADGFLLKHQEAWKIFWLCFGVKVTAIVGYVLLTKLWG